MRAYGAGHGAIVALRSRFAKTPRRRGTALAPYPRVCCIVAIGALIGPRVAIVAWWLLDPARWALVFSSVLWPILGLVLLPWTTLVYVWLAPGGIDTLGLIFLVLAVIADLSSYGGGYRSRRI